jgi:hypothetical protein
VTTAPASARSERVALTAGKWKRSSLTTKAIMHAAHYARHIVRSNSAAQLEVGEQGGRTQVATARLTLSDPIHHFVISSIRPSVEKWTVKKRTGKGKKKRAVQFYNPGCARARHCHSCVSQG